MRRLAILLCLSLASSAPAAVSIEAPSGPVPVGQWVVLDVTGAAVAPQVLLSPATEAARVDVARRGDQPCVVFWAEEPGQYSVLVLASDRRAPAADEYATATITADGVEPPPPPPPPPPPASHLSVQVIWEKSEPLPPEQWLLLNAQSIADWCEAGGHRLRRLDPDATDDDGDLVVQPRPETLPVVRVYNADNGELLWEGLPTSEENWLETMRAYVKDAQSGEPPRGENPVPSSSPPEALPCPTCPPQTQPRSQPTRRGLFRR